MSQLWGEFDDPEPKDTVPAEIIKYIIMQAMQQDPLRSPPPHEKLAIKPDPDAPVSDTLGLEMDDRVIHTVKLIQYSRDMNDVIDERVVPDYLNTMKLDLPEHPVPALKHQLNYPLQFMNKDSSDFCNGVGEPIPSVAEKTAKSLLTKAVAMLLVHNGFDKTSHSVLCTLTEAVEFFMQRIVRLMRVSVERGANAAVTGFPDAMERVFAEMGLGSVRCLHDYYQKNVIKRHGQLVEECRTLSVDYAHIPPQIKSEMQQKEERDEVPEIHLNDLAGDDGIESANALETGYQMLQSFEQEVRSQQESQEDGSESVSLEGYDFGNYKRIKL